MYASKPLAAIAMALALALGAPGIGAAQAPAHHDHKADELEIVLNNGAKWRGDQNMITGMTAIRGAIAAKLDAIHDGSLSADAAKGVAGDIQRQLDFMTANCVLEPAVDQQFHVVLAQVADGVSALEAGDVRDGAGKIVQALNAYGTHFEHPGWRVID